MPSTKTRRAEYNREFRKRYPKDWPQIRQRIRIRSKGRCECTGECGLHVGGRCPEINGRQGKNMAGTVRLACAHRNHVEKDCRDENLFDACQRCHLRYDRVIHAEGSRKTRNKRTGQVDALDEMALQDTILALRLDLDGNPMSVILVPAPEPSHSGHMIRVVASRPPPWYLKLCSQWGYARKRQGRLKRQRFMWALNRAAEGIFTGGTYMQAVLDLIKHAQRDSEEVFLAGR